MNIYNSCLIDNSFYLTGSNSVIQQQKRHMRHRQHVLLQFMKNPNVPVDVWPDAYWPENPVPVSKQVWKVAIEEFENELEEMIEIVNHPDSDLLEVHGNGKTLSWAVMTTFHHNAYTIGQIKAIGRQLGVW